MLSLAERPSPDVAAWLGVVPLTGAAEGIVTGWRSMDNVKLEGVMSGLKTVQCRLDRQEQWAWMEGEKVAKREVMVLAVLNLLAVCVETLVLRCWG